MKNLRSLSREELLSEQKKLSDVYEGYKQQALKLDMSRGKPSAEQLDLSMDMLNLHAYKTQSGMDVRNYGCLEGIPEARVFFGEILGAKPDEVFVGGNSSLSMMYSMIELGTRAGFADSPAPWGAGKPRFLCPAPGYDRHFRVTEYFGYELITVPMTPTGPDMDEVERLVLDENVKGIWCVPLYSNPDGYSYSDETVKRLAKMQTGAPDFKIFWDNAYCVHHLSDTPDKVLNMLDEARAAGNENRVLMFCSLSKVTFAGGGVAAMAASRENIDYILKSVFPMTISFDKLNQLRHVLFLKDAQGVAAHMEKQRAIVEPKFRTVLRILAEELGEENAHWTKPNGGYFISLYTMDGCAKRTVQLCREAGVVLTGAGAAYPYGIDPADSNIRIAPTYPPLSELETATHLLCVCAQLSMIEALLNRA